MRKISLRLLLLSVALTVFACGGKDRFEKSPVDDIISQKGLLDNKETFSIILYDMDVDDSKGVYKHKYQVKTNLEDSTKKADITDWMPVSEYFAADHINDMGMELASRGEDGELHKTPAPPGYNTVVGNSKYGQWKTDSNGNSFWAFYGQYMFMRTMFHMALGPPIYRSSYTGYRSHMSNPSTRSKAYYGSGRNTYGTRSASSRSMNPSFHQNRMSKASSFRSKVVSNPSRYSRSSRSRSSRYGRSSGSSYRSRGGSYGK